MTLDDEVLDFVNRRAKHRSRFINNILLKEKQRILMQELAAAYAEQASDPELQSEITVWDVTAGDGLNA